MFFDVFRTGTSLTPNERTDTLMLCQGERAIVETTFATPATSCSTRIRASLPSLAGWDSSRR